METKLEQANKSSRNCISEVKRGKSAERTEPRGVGKRKKEKQTGVSICHPIHRFDCLILIVYFV